jgi:hypothetical protein
MEKLHQDDRKSTQNNPDFFYTAGLLPASIYSDCSVIFTPTKEKHEWSEGHRDATPLTPSIYITNMNPRPFLEYS